MASKTKATLGTTVIYRLTETDVKNILERRASSNVDGTHILTGNPVEVGTEAPAVIVAVWDTRTNTCNLQVTLDGNDSLWATSVKESSKKEPGTWSYLRSAAPSQTGAGDSAAAQ